MPYETQPQFSISSKVCCHNLQTAIKLAKSALHRHNESAVNKPPPKFKPAFMHIPVASHRKTFAIETVAECRFIVERKFQCCFLRGIIEIFRDKSPKNVLVFLNAHKMLYLIRVSQTRGLKRCYSAQLQTSVPHLAAFLLALHAF